MESPIRSPSTSLDGYATRSRSARKIGQPPWTITGLAKAIGIENRQISNLNRYVNIGVSVSGYTHWRPDWMLSIAKVLEIPVDFNLTESRPVAGGGRGRDDRNPPRIVR